MTQYLVTYLREYDFSKATQYKILDYPAGLTWRELQQRFDPGYHHDNLTFYNLGSKILLSE